MNRGSCSLFLAYSFLLFCVVHLLLPVTSRTRRALGQSIVTAERSTRFVQSLWIDLQVPFVLATRNRSGQQRPMAYRLAVCSCLQGPINVFVLFFNVEWTSSSLQAFDGAIQ
jgi:hypothetical protein